MVLKNVTALEHTRYRVKYNLSKRDLKDLQDLASDKSITVKPTDKGGGIVLLNTNNYVNEAYRQLNDHSSYSRISRDPTRSIMNIIKVILQEAVALNYIDSKLVDFLTVDFTKVPKFYLLPKLHKP